MKTERIFTLLAVAASLVSLVIAMLAHSSPAADPPPHLELQRVTCAVNRGDKLQLQVAPDKIVWCYLDEQGTQRCVFMTADDARALVKLVRVSEDATDQ